MAIPTGGILAPVTTPFTKDGELDGSGLAANIAKYNATALAGYVVVGSTGEAVFLDRDEKLRAFEIVRGAAARGKTLVAGTGAESVRETVALTNRAAEMDYDAALVITPHYYRGQMARAESLVGFYSAVADAARIPLLIYNIPQNTGIDMAAEIVARLAGHGNIVGVKESAAEMAKIESMIRGVPAGFRVFVCASAKYHAALCAGATGGILAIADALPCSTMEIETRYRSGDVEGSRLAQERIAAAAGVAPRFGIQGLKYAMDLKGFRGGNPRPPLLPVGEAEKREIEALLDPIAEFDLAGLANA